MEGDLDWIVMRCLDKDRARRYDTATALALDINRYLHDEPVEACPPTHAYRLRKFMHRNKAAVLAGSTIVVLLVSAIVILAVSNTRIRRESEARAKALRAKESSLDITRETAVQMARLVTQMDHRLSANPGGEVDSKALREASLRHLELVLKQAEKDDEFNDSVFVILEQIAETQIDFFHFNEARQTCQRAIEIAHKCLDGEPDSPVYLANLGRARERMLLIMFTQLFTENQTGAKEIELLAYCNELVDLRREFNHRHPENLQPMAFCFWTLGKVALDRRGDPIAAGQFFRQSIWQSEEYLSQNPSDASERLTASKNAIWLGRLLQNSSAAGPDNALPMFELGHRWVQAVHEDRPSQWARGTAAIAELELGICQLQVRPSEHAITLLQHASAALRRLNVNTHYPPGDVTVVLYQARRAQAALIRELQRLERSAEAAEAARHMADWLSEIPRRVSDDANVYRSLQLAQTESVGLLCATGQHAEAVQACRQQITFWEEVQRNKPSENFKSYMAGRYLTLIRLLTEIGQVDEAKEAVAQAHEKGLTDPSTLNQLARNLVTALFAEPPPMAWQIGPDIAALAVEAAQQATNASPHEGNYWSTLGAAQYCAGKSQNAIEALETSMDLRGGGGAFDWFFLAMAHWQLDQREASRTWYDKAAQWMDVNEPGNEKLRRFRVGANVLIGISEAASPTESVELSVAYADGSPS